MVPLVRSNRLTFSWWDGFGGVSWSGSSTCPVLGSFATQSNIRFAICGAISSYNSRHPVGPRNFNNIISQRIRLEGFIIMDYEKLYTEAQKELAGWIKSGKLKRRDYIVEGGIEKAEEGLRGLFEGKNLGKCLIKVGKEKSRL